MEVSSCFKKKRDVLNWQSSKIIYVVLENVKFRIFSQTKFIKPSRPGVVGVEICIDKKINITYNRNKKKKRGKSMNNEEKIISMLEKMNDKIENIDSRLANVETKVGSLETDMQTVKREVVKTNMTIENKVNKNIQILVEGHQGLVDKLWRLPEQVDDIQESVSILKFVQKEMAKKVNK